MGAAKDIVEGTGHKSDLGKFAAKASSRESHSTPAPNMTRLLAFFLDAFLLGILQGAATAVFKQIAPNALFGPLLLAFAMPFLYTILPLYSSGQTLGKKLLKLKVISEKPHGEFGFGQVIFREWFGKFIASAVFFLGFIAIFRDPQHRAWYDKWAKTRVVSVAE